MTPRPSGVRIEALADGVGPPMGPFARELRTGTGAATAFLPALPTDDAAWLQWIEAAAEPGPIPEALAARLTARQEVLGAGAQAVANARALSEPGTVAIVTGQQPGLFGGSLLTAHKVAGAVNLARRLDGLGGHRVVPVFWSASEDHDFDEANRATVVSRGGELTTIRVAGGADGRSIADLELEDGALQEALAALTAALPDTDRGRDAVARLAPAVGDDFATASVRALLALFGDVGLVVVEPEKLWPGSGETLGWLIEHAHAIGSAVRDTGSALRAAGLIAPLDPGPDWAPVFYREAARGPRLRVALDGNGGVSLRGTPADLDADALARLVRAHPERGSGNVVGRVFVQNRHLPVLAYVAGPTEIAYQAQVRRAALDLGLAFPLALPRPEATWVEARAARTASDLGLSVPGVLLGAEPELDSDDELQQALAAARAHLAAWPSAYRALSDRGGRTAAAADRAFERVQQAFEKAAAGIEKAAAGDAGIGRGRFERLRAGLLPGGRPQERLLSPWSVVARHGIDAVRSGLRSLDPLEPAHFLVHVGGENGDA